MLKHTFRVKVADMHYGCWCIVVEWSQPLIASHCRISDQLSAGAMQRSSGRQAQTLTPLRLQLGKAATMLPVVCCQGRASACGVTWVSTDYCYLQPLDQA